MLSRTLKIQLHVIHVVSGTIRTVCQWGTKYLIVILKMKNLEWICTNGALNNISNSVFDSSISSDASDVPQRKKAKHLCISVSNFQSIWNKHVLIKQLMTLMC